ncbi:cyanophycinase [Rheinheimera sp.]|uniref:cyanophycinase n=1 Tax=Rheinheimera sp. TaxID=1869214 RepID=UPI003AF52E09
MAELRTKALCSAVLMLCGLPLLATAHFSTGPVSAEPQAGASNPGKELWLFGGGEPICSSVELHKCAKAKTAEAQAYFERTQALREKQFMVSSTALTQWQQSTLWPGPATRRQQLKAALLAKLQSVQGKVIGEADWYRTLDSLDLTGDEHSLLDDWFEQRPQLADGSTQTMQVYFAGTELYVQQMFLAFVASGRERAVQRRGQSVEKPRLVLITASSYNVFEWVDYYRQLFSAAGAEVQWLPIEPALVQDGRCDQLDQQRLVWNGQYQRAARYPELAAYQQQFCRQPAKQLELMQSADLVFINGGDQSLTMRSLQLADGQWTELAAMLHRRLAEGVPLGGSSAGTAVQSGRSGSTIPMISGGSTETALLHGTLAVAADRPLCALFDHCNPVLQQDRLTYKADGGLRSFTLGITDTHFREREREGRLLRLVMDTKAPAGAGVDEATVLRANFSSDLKASLSVMGHGGVWLVLPENSMQQQQLSSGWRVEGLQASRLLPGDTAVLEPGRLQVQLDCPVSAQVPAHKVDPLTYRAQAQWHWLQKDQLVQACQRADGVWRYQHLPLVLEVTDAKS